MTARMELDKQAILNEDALGKYRTAASIVNDAMHQLVSNCIPSADVYTLCADADRYVEERLAALGFEGEVASIPTCISINNCFGYNSPTQAGVQLLNAGDVVKITMGCHVDGHIAVHGHTHVVGVLDRPLTGRPADVVVATYCAAEAVQRMLRPGLKSEAIPHMIEMVAAYFRCKPVASNYSCSMRRFVLEGDKIVLNAKSEDRPADFVVQEGEVYNIDIALSTGMGHVREKDTRPTVFQRDLNTQFQLRTRAARSLYAQITAKHPSMPFSIRGFALKDRLGLKDCLDHHLLVPYAVQYENDGTYVAQLKFTAIVMAEGTVRLCSHPPPFVKTAYEVKNQEILDMLAETAVKEGPDAPLPVNCKKEDFQAIAMEE
eukprot:m.23639 g.23639  ORF g.23639 m.23639 type:complete len:375 (+) comp9530_c0_seq1:74-1198(+)